MKNDLSQSGVAVYTARRRNKSIWLRACAILALVVVMLTGYTLAFPARTAERELICEQKEHVHDESCRVSVLSCGLEEGEEHIHSESCWTEKLICGLEEHVHGEECYAEPEAPELTEADPVTTGPADELPVLPPEEDLPAPTREPLPDAPPAELPTEPTEPVPAETEPAEPVTEPAPAPVDADVTERLAKLALIIRSIEFPEEGIDLAPYLESAIFQHEVGGALVDGTEFENGETVKASIIYDIPRDVVTPESKYVYYQLPEGIRPIEETSGEVMDDGVPVGVYTITEDGRIHILFNDEFANGNAIVGTVEFSSWLYANDDGTDRVIRFENDAGTITVIVPDEQKYDLSLEKTGAFSSDYRSADFVLTVSSEKGTGAPIDAIDLLTNQTPATLFSAVYDQNLTVRHIAADGTVTLLSGVSVSWSEDGTSFTVEQLPALGAGERYELCYTVELDPDLSASFELDNEAKATAGKLEATTNFFISYTCDVTKSGSFNPVTGLIDWVITVNPESRPVAGWRIEDDLPYPAVGKVLLTNANGVRYADLTPADGRTIRYTFPANAPARPYFIRYSTAAPSSAETVRNTVRLYNERETIVVSEVTVDERSEGVDKTLGAKFTEANGFVRTLWSFHVTLPVGEMESYSFRDNISTPVMDVNDGEYLDNNLHFSYAAALEEAFRGNLRLISDGVEYVYGDEANDYVRFELSYYSASGALVDPTDTETHVSRVVFTVTPLNGNSFHGYEIVAEDYPTWLDASQAEEDDYWSYQNYIYLHGGVYDVAPAFYRKGNAFEKQLLANGKYSADNTYVDYADCEGELEYRLLLDLTALAGEEITVTDLLPDGMELIADSPRIYYTTANFAGEYAGTFSQEGSFTVTREPVAGVGTLLSFHAEGVNELMKQTYAYIGIVYRVRLADEARWNDYTHNVEQFTNTASWGDYTDEHTVTVENQPKRLEKRGVQLSDTEGSPLSRVRFTLEINLGAEDLDPESDWIVLSDVLSSNIGAELELSSVRLYRYDPSRPNNLGNRVMPYEFSLSYDTSTRTLTARLKDETAYVMVYDYTVDNTAILDGQTQISNKASLAGIFESSSEVVLRGVSSSATAWQRVITVTKVDADNHAKVLPGAEFTLEYWDPEPQRWLPVTDEEGQARSYVSNEAGKIILSMLGTDKDLDSGTLYRMTETRAPVGYEMNNTVMFFICMPRVRTAEEDEIFDEAAKGSGVAIEDVTFFDWSGGSCVITNPFNGLTVNKRWFAYNGVEMDGSDLDPITVRLWCSTDPSGESELIPVPATETLQNPVTLGPDNNWSFTWDSLPGTDEAGAPLYYFVSEDPVPGFIPSYINNGVYGGTIVIQNDSEPYELPATGGKGSLGLAEIGVAMMLVAAAVYRKNKKFKKMEVNK